MNEKNVQLLGLVKDVQARVWERKNDDSGIVLVGYAVNIHGVALGVATPTQKTLPVGANVNEHALLLANQIVMSYHAEQTSHNADDVVTDNPFMTAFERVENKNVLCSIKWSDRYANNELSYFKNQIIPKLDQYAPYLTDMDMETITQELIARTKNNGNSHGEDDYATKTVMGHLRCTNFILHQLRKHTTFSLPGNTFEVRPVSLVQREQPKHIPAEVRMKLAKALLELAETPLAMGVALMLFCGLRTSEACAVVIGDVRVEENYVVVPVKGQIKNGKYTHDLKSPAAYRNAMGGKMMAKMMRKRIDILCEKGIDEEIIRITPLGGELDEDSSLKWCDPNALSAYGKELLLACGYTQALLNEMQILMNTEPDIDEDGNRLQDPTAYIMRRDYIGRCCNCCGMKSVDVDYLVGHKQETDGLVDYGNMLKQQDLGTQLNRYHFDYEKLPDEGVVQLDGCQQYFFEAAEYDRVIKFSLIANEANDDIRVMSDGEMKQLTVLTGAMDTSALRKNRPILGMEHPKEFYDEMEKRVENIDLSPFKNN